MNQDAGGKNRRTKKGVHKRKKTVKKATDVSPPKVDLALGIGPTYGLVLRATGGRPARFEVKVLTAEGLKTQNIAISGSLMRVRGMKIVKDMYVTIEGGQITHGFASEIEALAHGVPLGAFGAKDDLFQY